MGQQPAEDMREEEQAEKVDMPALLTYEQAAVRLGVGIERVKVLVIRHVLHPVKLERHRNKYLRTEEVEWYAAHRAGDTSPNPIAAQLVLSSPILMGSGGAVEQEALADAAARMVTATLPAVATLLQDAAMHRPLDRGQLERLRMSPEYAVTRQAVLNVADALR